MSTQARRDLENLKTVVLLSAVLNREFMSEIMQTIDNVDTSAEDFPQDMKSDWEKMTPIINGVIFDFTKNWDPKVESVRAKPLELLSLLMNSNLESLGFASKNTPEITDQVRVFILKKILNKVLVDVNMILDRLALIGESSLLTDEQVLANILQESRVGFF